MPELYDLWKVPKNDRARDIFYGHLKRRFEVNGVVDFEQLYYYIREALTLVFSKSAQLFTFNAIFIAIAVLLLDENRPYSKLMFIPLAGYFVSCAINSTIMFVRFNRSIASYASWMEDCDWNVDHIAKRARRVNLSIVISIASTIALIIVVIMIYTNIMNVLAVPGSTTP